jgi:hypothetical protein
MRTAWITGKEALRLRMINPIQVAETEPEAEMPPYMESFLAHLRLLVGVPFEYLIPDPRLLPDESIRFFYLDRSWTDRLVDGAIAVGKIGTREQAHHQAHHAAVSQQLDLTERIVRDLQRAHFSFPILKGRTPSGSADVITGFLLRSAAVSGWPQMDVRAYRIDIPEKLDPASSKATTNQLRTLRLERLSPSVLLALFEGVPQLVYLEEPHHAVQFGVNQAGFEFRIDLRDGTGNQIIPAPTAANPHPDPAFVRVPVRAAHNRVVAVAELRRRINQQRATFPQIPEQKGSSAFAIEVLQLPWRQRFEGTVDHAETAPGGSGAFVSFVMVANRVAETATKNAFVTLVQGKG